MTGKTTAKSWNGGLVGNPTPPAPIPTPGACPTEGCGQQLRQGRHRRIGWAFVEVYGSREPGRLYCCGACAAYGLALAEVRALPGPEGGDVQ